MTRLRRGSVTLEAILVIPILVIATVALVQFFVSATVHQAAVTAAAEGARVAALVDADMDDVQDAVDESLAAVNLAVGPQVTVIRQFFGSTDIRGGHPCTPPLSPPLSVDETQVTVCIDLTASPLLNKLQTFGVNVAGKTMTTTIRRYRE